MSAEEADELGTILTDALWRCDLYGLPFKGHHTPKAPRAQADQFAIRAAFAAAVDDPRHGTQNGYSNFHCRCDPCRAARPNQTGRAKPKEPPVSKVSDLFDPTPGIPHGTTKGALEWSSTAS